MARDNKGSVLGGWAFLIGVVIAVILGLFIDISGIVWLLVVIGLIVGLLNVTDEETTPFLMSCAVLIIASALGGNSLDSVPRIGDVLDALLAIFVPATIIVAIKNVFSIARR